MVAGRSTQPLGVMVKHPALRIIVAIAIGVAITMAMAYASHVAWRNHAEIVSHVLLWPNTLLQTLVPLNNVNTTEHPVYEATPVNIVAYLASYPIGAVVYSMAAYFLLFRRKGQP